MPVPVIVVDPADSVTVQVPAAGNPLRSTLPVATPQVGWMRAPAGTAVDRVGRVVITTQPQTQEGESGSHTCT